MKNKMPRVPIGEVRKKAKELNINTYRMKKEDIIRAIQRAEQSVECFGTERIADCNEMECWWRNDCLDTPH